MKKRLMVLGAVGALAAGAMSWGAAANDVEQPNYEVIQQADNIEIRQYQPMIVAEATVTGDRGRAMNRGFRIIADYIFGNNTAKQSVAADGSKMSKKIAMTSPVTQQSSEKIAMTSPVTQQPMGDEGGNGPWQVRFIMPAEYTMETLPTPNNPRVTLLEVPGKRMAAIRFSGRGRMADMDMHTAQLREFLTANDLQAAGEPSFAFYDGPWVPGPMRRNEVMIEIAAAE